MSRSTTRKPIRKNKNVLNVNFLLEIEKRVILENAIKD